MNDDNGDIAKKQKNVESLARQLAKDEAELLYARSQTKRASVAHSLGAFAPNHNQTLRALQETSDEEDRWVANVRGSRDALHRASRELEEMQKEAHRLRREAERRDYPYGR